MRYLAGLVFVLALGAMGCSETTGTGGNGGVGGDGGTGGVGGEGGVGGVGAEGGTGGGGDGGVGGCGIDDEWRFCRADSQDGLCADEVCMIISCTEVEEGSPCLYAFGGKDMRFGICVGGVCEIECEVLEEGAECRAGYPFGVESYGVGECVGPICAGEVVENCEEGRGTQRLSCRTDLVPAGLCADEVCVAFDCAEAEDGAYCNYFLPNRGPFFGICVGGVCEIECEVLGDGAECRASVPQVPMSYGEDGVCVEGDCVEP